jgi:hypothetical protein
MGAWTGWIFWLAALVAQTAPAAPEPTPESCADPIFAQVEARLLERVSVTERLSGYQEFLRLYPENPCAPFARRRIEQLSTSPDHQAETERQAAWIQQAEGGVLAPGQDTLPPWIGIFDPAPRNQLRLTNQLVWLSSAGAGPAGLSNPVAVHALGIDVAPVYNLALSAELPLISGAGAGEGFGTAIGNFTLGFRAIWGTFLGENEFPFILSGGVLWGSGSSTWSSQARAPLLDALAYAYPPGFHRARFDQTDYVPHFEMELGLGRHFLVAVLSAHFLAQGEAPAFSAVPRVDPVDAFLRFDLAYQLRLSERVIPFLQVGGGMGKPESSRTSHLFLTPGAQLVLGRFSLALSANLPLWTAGGFGRFGLTLDVLMKTW